MRNRRNPQVPANIAKRYSDLRRVAATGSGASENERATASRVMAQLEAAYPGIGAAQPERSVEDWQTWFTKRSARVPRQSVEPTAPIEPLGTDVPWPAIMDSVAEKLGIKHSWATISRGVFLGIRKGGLIDVYVNNTYKMTSPSLRAVVGHLVEIVRGQIGATAGAWKGYNIFLGREEPPSLDVVPLGDLARNTASYLAAPQTEAEEQSPPEPVNAPGISKVSVMDPNDFEAEE